MQCVISPFPINFRLPRSEASVCVCSSSMILPMENELSLLFLRAAALYVFLYWLCLESANACSLSERTPVLPFYSHGEEDNALAGAQ